MIHFGQMKCGKVDQFGKLFHVVSDFFHVNFIPLVPLRSYLVLNTAARDSEEAQFPLPMSLKSVLAAWVRAALIVLILLNTLACLRGLPRLLLDQRDHRPAQAARRQAALDGVINPLALVVGFAIFLGLSYRFSRANFTRALHLGALLGLTEEDLDAHLERLYRSVPPSETLEAVPE
jgi:hypothetical protein